MSLRESLMLAASEVPAPGTLSFVALAGMVGTFVGGLVGRIRGLSPSEVGHATGTGTWIGIGVGFATWFAALAIDRL